MGIFTFIEFYADIFICWLPFYYEVKILFLVWLVLPRTRGAPIVWSQYLKPFLNAREKNIDKAVDEARTQISAKIDAVKSQAVNAVAARALCYIESTKSPLLASILGPLIVSATQPQEKIASVRLCESIRLAVERSLIIWVPFDRLSNSVFFCCCCCCFVFFWQEATTGPTVEELPDEPTGSAPTTPAKPELTMAMITAPLPSLDLQLYTPQKKSSPAKIANDADGTGSPNSSYVFRKFSSPCRFV